MQSLAFEEHENEPGLYQEVLFLLANIYFVHLGFQLKISDSLPTATTSSPTDMKGDF
jgi:hypothetical protein